MFWLSTGEHVVSSLGMHRKVHDLRPLTWSSPVSVALQMI